MLMTNIFEITNIDIWAIAKWFYVLGFGIYFLFALVVWRQTQLMSIALQGKMVLPIKTVGLALVILAGTVLALSLVVL